MIGLALLVVVATRPVPVPLKVFADWTVGCDNGRACQANALQPEDDFDALTIIIARGAEANARTDISFKTDLMAVAALSVDGRKLSIRPALLDGFLSIRAEDVGAFVDAVKPAKRLGLIDARGEEVGHASLAGLVAALLYMDEQQKRVGTVTALIRKGAAINVQRPPALPVIASPATPKLPPRMLSKADIAGDIGSLDCEPDASHEAAPTYARLDARTTLALLLLPCGQSAYNFFSHALLIDERGRVRPAGFDAEPAMGDENDNSVVNSEWDARTRLLTVYGKGRGLGDCGVSQSYAWDGQRFRLAEQAEMGECRGGVDYITTWRATVITR
jgi:hypothetical protein